jgi:hypothetical protein
MTSATIVNFMLVPREMKRALEEAAREHVFAGEVVQRVEESWRVSPSEGRPVFSSDDALVRAVLGTERKGFRIVLRSPAAQERHFQLAGGQSIHSSPPGRRRTIRRSHSRPDCGSGSEVGISPPNVTR